jgi:hypothetical protein
MIYMAKVKSGAMGSDVVLDAPSDVTLEEVAKPADVIIDEKVVTAADVATKPPEVKPTPVAVNAKKVFAVSLGDKSGRYSARDADEAWALFCDHHKTYPSPKHPDRKIEEVG